MSEWSNASVTIGAPRRGGGKQEPWKFVCQSMSLTWSWGAQPASGTLTYVSSKAYPPIVYDAAMEVECFGKQFWGVCRSGPLIQVNEDGTAESLATLLSSGGHELQLGFVDCRYYLNKDVVFCAYNLPDKRIASDGPSGTGQPMRMRRYKHLRPWQARLNYWTYTLQPLSAAEIIREIMSYNVANTNFAKEATIGSVWSGQFHPDMERFAVFNIEARDGRTLDDVLVEISEKLGLMFTLMGGPFNLVWARRGEGGSATGIGSATGHGSATGQMLPPPPEKFDDRVLRVEMTDHPTRLFVVGDRNIYVKLDLPLVPDWNRAWEEVFDVDLLMQDLFDHDAAYNAISNDVEHAQGYQLAAARAREITVREYAEIRAARGGSATGLGSGASRTCLSGQDFTDFRLFGGRSRMDLPAAMYIDQLLFRAFRPPPVVNLGAGEVPIEALEIVEDLPARITHDPVSGVMTAHLDNISGGNGYLITRGFRVGQELFLVLQPERFDVDLFLKSTELWAPLTFQIDNSGETGRFIVMDEKVVKTSNLIAWAKSDGDWLNGYAVLNANPTFEIPEVRAALVFAGDRFYAPQSKGLLNPKNNGRDGVVYESGLYREAIVHSSNMGTRLTEIPYADGDLAWLKAIRIAEPLLARPTWYWTGSQRWILRPGDQIPDLTGMIDRITLTQSDTGHECMMEFGGERVPRTKMLERDYDRLSRMRTVIPRQQELLNEARMMREIATVFRTNPDIARRMMQETQRVLGANPMEGYARITIRGGNGRFAAGTPLRKASKQTTKDTETGAFKNSNTWAVMPADASPADNQFVGVTVRNGENAAGNLRVQASGVALARVQGPVTAGDNLVLAKADGAAVPAPGDYLVKEDKGDTGAMAVGRAMEAVSGSEVKLIRVWLGVGAGGKGGGFGVWA